MDGAQLAAGRQPSRPAGPGRSPTARRRRPAARGAAAAPGRRRSGGARRRSAPVRGARSAAIAASSAGSVMAHSRCRMPSAVLASASGGRCRAASVTIRVAAPGPSPRGRLAVVEQEDRLQVGLGGLHQRQPPGHRARRHVLVRQHDPGLAGDQPQPRRSGRAAAGPPSGRRRRGTLLVDVQRRARRRAPGSRRPATAPGAAAAPSHELPGLRRPRCRGRMIRTTLCGSAASNWSSFSLAMTSYGGEVTSASPLTRVLGVADAPERRQDEAGRASVGWPVAGRKDLHVCQKDRTAASDSRRTREAAETSDGRRCLSRFTSAAWSLLEPRQRRGRGPGPERAAAAEPQSRSVLEALARAQFDAGRYADGRGQLPAHRRGQPHRRLRPVRAGPGPGPDRRPGAAAEHLALAAAMRPDLRHYTEALRSVRAHTEHSGPAQRTGTDD